MQATTQPDDSLSDEMPNAQIHVVDLSKQKKQILKEQLSSGTGSVLSMIMRQNSETEIKNHQNE